MSSQLQVSHVRKPHKKNRTGCYACKRRRIKCPEQKPICHTCLRKGEDCVYPQNIINSHASPSTSNTPNTPNTPIVTTISTPLSSQPSFSLQDIRFFHHFLTIAFPYLPSCDDYIWTTIVPLYAEQSSYLMHAVMALGASHLGALSNVDHSKAAQYHRSAAITGLQQAMADKLKTVTEHDTAFASCHILSFQSMYLDDAVGDMITTTRGCHLLMAKAREQHLPSVFGEHFEGKQKIACMPPFLSSPHNPVFIQQGIGELQAFESRLTTPTQLLFLRLLITVLELLQSSPQAGCMQFHGLYEYWCTLDQQSFAEFVDATNSDTQVLITYMLAVQLLLYPFFASHWPDRARHSRLHTFKGTSMWTYQMASRITAPEVQRYLEWPKTIVSAVQQYIGDGTDHDIERNYPALELPSSSSSSLLLSLTSSSSSSSSPSSSSSNALPVARS